MTYQPGDIVDITIKGARVTEVCRHGDGGDDLRFTYEAGDGDLCPGSVWAQTSSVSITRRVPVEWPPQVGDLWRDWTGGLWVALGDGRGPRVIGLLFVPQPTDGEQDPGSVSAEHGPLTLVHREPDAQVGGDHG